VSAHRIAYNLAPLFLGLWSLLTVGAGLLAMTVVKLMPPSLASQLLQDLRGYVGFVA
jgi:hypothetical protein